jgi:hypothetical protein
MPSINKDAALSVVDAFRYRNSMKSSDFGAHHKGNSAKPKFSDWSKS